MRGPSECPNCGHDPTGDDDTFQSGGGWIFDHSLSDGSFREELYCPICEHIVWTDSTEMGSRRI